MTPTGAPGAADTEPSGGPSPDPPASGERLAGLGSTTALLTLAVAAGRGTTKATGVSPHCGDGTPTTATSATSGCSRN